MRKIFLMFIMLSCVPVWCQALEHPDAVAMPMLEVAGSDGHIIMTLFDSGKCEGDCTRQTISAQEAGAIQDAILESNFEEVHSKRPGTCLPSYLGKSTVFIFRAQDGDEHVDTCEYAIDVTKEPFKTLLKVMEDKQ